MATMNIPLGVLKVDMGIAEIAGIWQRKLNMESAFFNFHFSFVHNNTMASIADGVDDCALEYP